MRGLVSGHFIEQAYQLLLIDDPEQHLYQVKHHFDAARKWLGRADATPTPLELPGLAFAGVLPSAANDRYMWRRELVESRDGLLSLAAGRLVADPFAASQRERQTAEDWAARLIAVAAAKVAASRPRRLAGTARQRESAIRAVLRRLQQRLLRLVLSATVLPVGPSPLRAPASQVVTAARRPIRGPACFPFAVPL